MTDEPYRWVEAIANRREYIETQLAGGSPVILLQTREGLLLLTFGRERQKIFEIYDRIAMSAIGHPADIERLRMLALEVASSEGFARSADDVSLRRLVSYSIAPVVKTAFEQIYGAPYLGRLLFAELGRSGQPDSAIALDYDGNFQPIIPPPNKPLASGLAGISRVATAIRERLVQYDTALDLRDAIAFAARCWAASMLESALPDGGHVSEDDIAAKIQILRDENSMEACVLSERKGSRVCFRRLPSNESGL